MTSSAQINRQRNTVNSITVSPAKLHETILTETIDHQLDHKTDDKVGDSDKQRRGRAERKNSSVVKSILHTGHIGELKKKLMLY